MLRKRVLALCALALCGFGADATDQVAACLRREAHKITAAAAAEISDRKTWEPVRAKRAEELREMLGLLPWPARTPLNVQITGREDRGTFTVENIAFESMPHIYVTANLYVPKQRRGKVPAIIYVCGHSYSPQGDKVQYQRHGISFAKNGYAAMILDSIQIAETFGLHHGTHALNMFDWYARAYSPAGVEVWNAIRAIDYLETRPEVDAGRIGMTGRSGGAGMSWFTAAIDDRVKVAAPVMGISTYAANLDLNTQRLHCDCMFPVNFLRQDLMHLAALIAPRPLLMAHGRKDDLFPLAGVDEVESRVGGLYESYGRRPEFRNIYVDTGHSDSDYLREQAIRWFDRFLMRTADDRRLDMSYENVPGERLAVFRNGPPKDAENYRVQETFLPTPAFKKYANAAAWTTRRNELLGQLKTKVFGAFPQAGAVPGLSKKTGRPAYGYEDFGMESEEGVEVRLLQSPSKGTGLPAVLYVASDGEDPAAVGAFLNPVSGAEARKAILYPRGVSETPWNRTTWRDMMRNSMHVGRSVDSMRLWDVLQAIRVLQADPAVDGKRITLAGKGTSAALALYAAILNETVEQVVMLEPPSTHVEGPFFLGVLRYTDLPEAAALVAPRRVLFYNRMPPAYEAARQIFAAQGAAANLGVTMTMRGPVAHQYEHEFASGY